jgi:hypothetical protein
MATKPTDTTNYTKMEALKDILFGQEMNGMEERIIAIEDKFDVYIQAQQQTIADLKVHFDDKITKATAAIEQTVAKTNHAQHQLTTDLSAQKNTIETQLKQIQAEITQKITALDNTNAADLTAIGKALSELGARLIKSK